MSEENSIFKFKKAATKKIGPFDVMDSSEWTLLTKPQIQDVTLFVHFRKVWNVEEKPEEFDADGNMVKEAVKAYPAYEFITGFIKDDKYLIQNRKPVSEKTYHEIHKRYILNLQHLLAEGYDKDWNNYKLDEPQVPHYYINERVSEEETLQQALIKSGRRSALVNNVINTNTPASNQAPAQVIPTKNKKFSFLRMNPAVMSNDQTEEETENQNP